MRFCFSCGPRIFYRCFRELTIFGNKRSKKFFLKYHQRRVFCILKLKIAKNSEESSLYLIFFCWTSSGTCLPRNGSNSSEYIFFKALAKKVNVVFPPPQHPLTVLFPLTIQMKVYEKHETNMKLFKFVWLF